jgi:uncharacterized protein YjbJ (UPF0337 family)
MDENRIEGTARNMGGKLQEGLGRISGDAATQARGLGNQAAGSAQDLYGQAKDAAAGTATSLDDWFRHTAKSQPYVTALAILGVGWMLGRMHRPY